ncbi:5-(carboxyamino)imidazole ribonucleotide mutase [Notoacmeibacter sp. MSK16QG-6]|uniref:5-(carboxyamino)imidazole ribonucleotide mutase n=1 Tax=Notoacmeibacter sp. MSK16QG-6 TaxID=2957982 RepID=UPI00209DCC52|nr:5-(carboxyamino)imidazole ribonucleotide mutase [Notoacmeibacter sp. MSK16QG-6]MCP1201083.1 5-(carboxyamino)imidazole ribonucleotide mutase [Notoacmeibacter sp. MSK16QG-6]
MRKDRSILVAMGSQSDWPTMAHTAGMLDDFGVRYETAIISAHRTPDRLDHLTTRLSNDEFYVVIAGAGGAAHLAGALAARTIVPVIGIPISSHLQGLDSLLSTVQMPAGVPVATVSIGVAGAKNAALLALQIVAVNDKAISDKLVQHRQQQSLSIPKVPKTAMAAE